MPPLAIVPDLNVVEYLLTRCLPCGEIMTMHQLLFERSKETLDRRVIPTISFAAHTASDPLLRECLLKISTRVLTATVAVMQYSFC